MSNIINTLISIYCAFHSITCHVIHFQHISSESGKIFTLQKKISRSRAGTQPRTSYRSLLKQSDSTCSMSVIHSLMTFIIYNQENFQTNSSIHNNNTGNKLHLHRPNGSLSCFQKVHSMLA